MASVLCPQCHATSTGFFCVCGADLRSLYPESVAPPKNFTPQAGKRLPTGAAFVEGLAAAPSTNVGAPQMYQDAPTGPSTPVKRHAIGVAILVSVLAAGGAYWRTATVQPVRDEAIAASDGFRVDVHMRGFDPGTLVLDAEGESAAPVDLARIALATCTAIKDYSLGSSLVLAHNGSEKFLLDAEAVGEIGDRAERTPYRLRVLVTRARPLDGGPAFEDPQGGLLYVLRVSAENTTSFARRWLGIAAQ